MRVRLKLKPGQRGTKNLVTQYGNRLICVRYRYDEKTRKRYTTVELIVAEAPWIAPLYKPDTLVQIKIGFDETELRQNVKDVGGMWSKSTKTWKLPYKKVRELGLKTRIMETIAE